MKVRTRFAPSPTGFVHVGSFYSVLLDYAWAKKNKGKFIVRIENTDIKRYVKKAEEKIYEALDWLGIKEDESPRVGGPHSPYRQSERLKIYRQHAEELIKKGHAYYCFCSKKRLDKVREEQKKRKQPPMYDRQCRQLNSRESATRVGKSESHVIRMKIPDNEKIVIPDLIRGDVIFDCNVVDDQVLIKSDGFPTYHLAAIVDDHFMEITHAIRGEEWLSSAPKHFLLYRYFGWEPPIYLHTPTIRDESRRKLSKRLGHTSFDWYRDQGFLPEALLNFLCLLGWSHPQEKEIFGLEEFIKKFDLKDISPVGPIFDLRKLEWMNGVYIRKKSDRELQQLLKPFTPKGMKVTLINQSVPLIKNRLQKLSGYPDLVDFFVKKPMVDFKLVVKKGGGDKDLIKVQFETLVKKLEGVKIWKAKRLEEIFRNLANKLNWHVGKFFMAVRIVLTGKTATPPLFETMEVLGKKKTLKRLKLVVKNY